MGTRRLQICALWLLPALAVAAFWAGLARLHAGAAQVPRGPGVIALTEARFVAAPVAATATAGANTAAKAATELPDDWSRTRPQERAGRYRFHFELADTPSGDRALYLSSVNARPDLRLNGRRVLSGAGFAQPTARSWHVPVYATVPEGTLLAGRNDLEIALRVGDPGVGYLGAAYLGSASALRPAYEARHFLQVTAPQIIALAVALFSALMFALFALRPKETVYGWVAALFAVLALGFVNILVLDSRIPRPPGAWVGVVSMAWFATLGLIFVNRLFEFRQVRLERTLLVTAAGGTAGWTGFYPPTGHALALALWGGLWLAVATIPAWRVVREHARRADFETALMFTSSLMILTCSVHDVAMVNGALSRAHDSSIQYAGIAGVGVFAWIFLNRFIRALHTAEELTAELEARVASKHAELEENYRRMRDLERERTLSQERERILGEIHDGLGGQLISTLAMTEGGSAALEDVSLALRSALDDLRLVIHSLDASGQDLLTVLGAWRARIQPRLEAAGVRVRWQVEDLPELAPLGPERTLHVLRILQEAVTNALKHAGARTLTLSTAVVAGAAGAPGAVVQLEDDGCGIQGGPGSGPTGQGLAQIRRRAALAGAELTLDSDSAGTRVRVWLPGGSPESGMAAPRPCE